MKSRFETCPALNGLTDYDRSVSDFLFRNRDMESNNLIIVNEYDLSKQDLIYSHFMIMYIYN